MENGIIQNKLFYPQTVYMQSIVECYQWIETNASFCLRTVPNGRVDAWIKTTGNFTFEGDEHVENIVAPEFGFFPLSDKGTNLRLGENIKAFNIKFFPHVLGFASLKKLQQLPGPISFQDLFSSHAVNLLKRKINKTTSIENTIEIAEQFFESVFLSDTDENNWLKSVLKYVEKVPHDEITVAKLAKAAHVSVKTMERRFLQTIGINPKMFCKIIRFQQAVKEIQNKNITVHKNSSVALTGGYYDQSHFAKEAKQFTGYSPKKMLLHFAPETSDIILLP